MKIDPEVLQLLQDPASQDLAALEILEDEIFELAPKADDTGDPALRQQCKELDRIIDLLRAYTKKYRR